jgi:hypothetical protein
MYICGQRFHLLTNHRQQDVLRLRAVQLYFQLSVFGVCIIRQLQPRFEALLNIHPLSSIQRYYVKVQSSVVRLQIECRLLAFIVFVLQARAFRTVGYIVICLSPSTFIPYW